jgi:4-amino-4-deoxy-L-arabinose transferase-like glycosyltransferase
MTGRYARGSAWVFVLALALRMAWVLWQSASAGAPADFNQILSYPDEARHWELALNLTTEGEMITSEGRYASRQPIYPLFLAPFTYLGTTGIGLARLAQAVMGALTVMIVYRFARRAIGVEAGVLAGLLVCFDPYAVYFCNLLLNETLFTLIAVGLAYGCWKSLSNAPDLRFAGLFTIATCGPLAILTKSSCAGWVILVMLLASLPERTFARQARVFGIMAGVCLVVMLPWTIRNRVVLGEFSWLGTNGGISLYDGVHKDAKGDSDQRAFLDVLEQDPNFLALTEAERDRELSRLSWQAIKQDKWRITKLAGTKILRTWSPWPNNPEHRNGLSAWVGALFTIAVLLATVVGSVRLLRERRPVGSGNRRPSNAWLLVILLLPAFYFTAVHSVYVGSLRYRLPVMPMLCVVAGASIASGPRRIRQR